MRQKERLIQLIEAAKRDVSEAEADLEKALAEIIEAPRAEKITVSTVADSAFSTPGGRRAAGHLRPGLRPRSD